MIKSYKLRRRVSNGAIYIILGVMGIMWVLPLAWLIMTSFRGEQVVYPNYVIPKTFTFDNYINLFTDTSIVNFPRWFMNTLIVAIFTCIISTLSVLMVSYTFSRLRFKSRKLLINVGMILGMFPGFMTMIAVYHLLNVANLTRELIALIIVYSAGAALGYFIPKGFFDTIPRSLDEAALIDGATKNQIFWKIIMPMSKPIIVYVVLTAFMSAWQDFILVRIIMGDAMDNYTIAIGLYTMLDKNYINQYFLQFCAGSVVVGIPIAAVFMNMQKYYVEGVTGGAVKG